MKVFVLTSVLGMILFQAAHAWAILLGSPSLQYPPKAKKDTISAAETEMKKLDFEGGIIHVSAPSPSRQLRFKAPGQSANALLPLLEKLGFTVDVTIAATLPAKWGIVISQPEDGSHKVAVLINPKHPDFDRRKLAADPAPSAKDQPAPPALEETP